MQRIQYLLFVPMLALCLTNCQNQNQPATAESKPADTTAIAAPAPTGPIDTLVGFKGAERAAFKLDEQGRGEFQYQNHKVTVKDEVDSTTTGQNIMAAINGKNIYAIPFINNGFFAGIYNDRLFVDAGTGPDGREISIINLNTKKPVLRAPYVGEPEILSNGKMWYLRPAKEQDITKMPDCPERAEWEKNGLRVGYGQVCIYDLTNDSEIKKTEWRCVPLQ